jgi:hypothetical protein
MPAEMLRCAQHDILINLVRVKAWDNSTEKIEALWIQPCVKIRVREFF